MKTCYFCNGILTPEELCLWYDDWYNWYDWYVDDESLLAHDIYCCGDCLPDH